MLIALLIDPAGRAVLTGLQAEDEAMWQTAIETTSGEQDDAGTVAAIAALRHQYPEPWRFAGYLAPPTTWWQAHEHYFEPWVLAAVANNRAAIIGEYDIQGYNPAQLVQYQRAIAVMNGFEREYHESLLYGPGFDTPILDMLNTRFIIVPKTIPVESTGDGLIIDGYPAPGFQVVTETAGAVIVENLEHFPRAWLVYDVIERSADEALTAIGDGSIDPRTTASIEVPSNVSFGSSAGGGTTIVTDYEANQVEIVTSSDGPAFLLVADVHDPGWRVTIDGAPAQLHRANGLIRGVFGPGGEHTVRFEYRPPELRIGLTISAISVLTIAVLVGWAFQQRRATQRTHSTPRQ